MADAWETLLDKSTLTPPGFDAWEHLNAQGGGGGPSGYIIAENVTVQMVDNIVQVELVDDTVHVTIEE